MPTPNTSPASPRSSNTDMLSILSPHGGVIASIISAAIAAVLLKQEWVAKVKRQFILSAFFQKLLEDVLLERKEEAAKKSEVALAALMKHLLTAGKLSLSVKVSSSSDKTTQPCQDALCTFLLMQAALSEMSDRDFNTSWPSLRAPYIEAVKSAAFSSLTMEGDGVHILERDAQGEVVRAEIKTSAASHATVINVAQFREGLPKALEATVLKESPNAVAQRVVASHQEQKTGSELNKDVIEARTRTMVQEGTFAQLAVLKQLMDAVDKKPKTPEEYEEGIRKKKKPTRNIATLAKFSERLFTPPMGTPSASQVAQSKQKHDECDFQHTPSSPDRRLKSRSGF